MSGPTGSTAHALIGVLVALVVLVSAVSRAIRLTRPALATTAEESVTSGVVPYARAHAARAVPLSAVMPVLLAAGSCIRCRPGGC
ncbi:MULTISPECIES: hypothetical protein [unclassified Streptomyces]|uniref:hypothetical protein n=1 Tax=unclassified Streptomyces TaxID=2593676 RepID=UPI00274075C2|nr:MULTISPECIES: hypothetical protein [unclassified Streptomyces]